MSFLRLYLIELFVTVVVCVLVIGLIAWGVHFIKIDGTFNEKIVATILGVVTSIIVLQFIKIFEKYEKNEKSILLRNALFMEMGLIARALFHDLALNKGVSKNIKETFTITHSIIHSVGADISLLTKDEASDILEFHSLVKALLNISSSNLKYDTSNRVIARIVEIVSQYGFCKDIVSQSRLAEGYYRSWNM